MRTIDITQILSPDLKSRPKVGDLKLFIENCGDKEVILDFSKVKFATRSFIDEFYNVFLKNPSLDFEVKIDNVPEDIAAMLEAVSHTQPRAKVIPSTADVVRFKTIQEAIAYFSSSHV